MPEFYYDIIRLYFRSCFQTKGQLPLLTWRSLLMLSTAPLKICKTFSKGKKSLMRILFFDLIHNTSNHTGKKTCSSTPKNLWGIIKYLILIIEWKAFNHFFFHNRCHFLYISLCFSWPSITCAQKSKKKCFTNQR